MTAEKDLADEILDSKESYNFLKGAKRALVKVAMEEHTRQTLIRKTEQQIKELKDSTNLEDK